VKRDLTVDVAVIGAGSGGLSVASGAAQLGLKVVLFERGEMGGDCLNAGCVPSKSLIAAARAAQGGREAARFGVRFGEPEIDFAAVMAHVRSVIASIAPHDSQERFEGLGVTVVRERAGFTDPRTVESESVRVRFDRAVIATGSRPRSPPIPGLAETPHLTNESVFELRESPAHLLVLGAGPIGLELGQAFRRLGSQVSVLEADRALAKEDPEAAAVVLEALRREGVFIREGCAVQRVSAGPGGVSVELADGEVLGGTHLLAAAGRAPVVDGLGLEAAGIAYDRSGVKTDASLRTSNRRVFAVGDVAGRGAFTHQAGAHASLFVRHALFAQPIDADALVVPRVTYTEPELAAVGLTEAAARARHGEVRVLHSAFAGNDRARAEADTAGFAKVVVGRRGQVLGATVVGAGAGDLIAPWTFAVARKLKLTNLAQTVVAYPTRSEITKAAAGSAFTATLFSPRTRRLVALLKRVR
jgi:pyruvate/2-oxoglutarate dehydrogenase complex dihydrolipoamide dehydrogenase (E3) component